jgi:hypothetical protein
VVAVVQLMAGPAQHEQIARKLVAEPLVRAVVDFEVVRVRDVERAAVAGALPGTLGGHRRGRVYGRLDCPAARRAIDRGGYVEHRVFFADEATARAAGYRPCAVCLPEDYAAWNVARG